MFPIDRDSRGFVEKACQITALRISALALLACILITPAAAQSQFQRGDIDASGSIDVGDAVSLLGYLFGGGGLPFDCDDALDANDSGTVNIVDPVALLNFLFVPGAAPPPAPYPDCGVDPTPDPLSCVGPFGGCGGPIDAISLDLAGNPLSEYPHFEFVRAFNEGAVFSVAVDPTRTPSLIGQSAALFVVESKSESEWDADPSLVDVRPGGPQPINFGPSWIGNRIEVVESDLLSGDGGVDIGVGYDVVIDLDQDGFLSPGDAIDGRSEESGLYVIDDLTELGPLSVMSEAITLTVPGVLTAQMKLYLPTSITTLGPRPVVVISHGGGHDFTWYDYLGDLFASHGYFVMSHPNSFFDSPPISLSYLQALFEQQSTLLGGAFEGSLDSTRISFIGHSLGGQTAIRAYKALYDGLYTSTFFDATSIRFVSAIGANSILGPSVVSPEDVPFHVMYGSADGDISGSAGCDQCQPLRHYDRGSGYRHVTYIHGADHNDFNCCGFNNFMGPLGSEIGRPDVQDIAKSIYLALLEIYNDDNIPARDYLWRQWERFHPLNTLDDVTVVHAYSEDGLSGKIVIDDFQSAPQTTVSSSGGAVSGSVAEVFEGRLDDSDSVFAWTPSDPMNGMTHAGSQDDSAGVVFQWDGDASLEFEVIPALEDWSAHAYLSFRACQGTQHPLTLAVAGDLTFDVVLEDSAGNSSMINIGAYGGGIEQPYARQGGWQNEFETVRIRLRDFLADGSGLDLTRIVAVRLEFGPSHGSPEGRVGLDDLEVTAD